MRHERLAGDFVAGVIEHLEEVDAVVRELTSEGLSEDDVLVFTGPGGREEMDHLGGKGWVGRLRRDLEDYVGNAHEMRTRHQEEAERGMFVVIVNPADASHVARAHASLVSHGAREVVTRVSGVYRSV